MTLWQDLEDWLAVQDITEGWWFRQVALVEDLGIPGLEASRMIAAYQQAQVSPKVGTAYLIHRRPGTRTTSAVWEVEVRSEVAEHLGKQWASDAHRRVEIAIWPTLSEIGHRNPRAQRKVEAIMGGIGASLELIGAMLDGDG